MNVVCLNCKTEFEKKDSEIKKSPNHFCSKSCSNSFHNKINPKRRKEGTCKTCSIEINSSRTYCSECIKTYSKVLDLEKAKTDKTRKKILISKRGHQCEKCKLKEWNNSLIPLELEHIDGNSDNNTENNLSLLCPNCHAQTEHYKGANKGNGKRQITRRLRYANGQTY